METTNNRYTIPQESLKETQRAITKMIEDEIEPLDKSRELLSKAYQLFLKKQELIKRLQEDTWAITEEMEACIHFAFEALPANHQPEDWILIDQQKDIICKWVNPDDLTHLVEFQIIH